MNKDKFIQILIITLSILFSNKVNAQVTERERSAEWDDLVPGGRFIDRFLPIPATGKLTNNTWGASNVIPRYVDNGIEDNIWSYWGGNILIGDDGKYHLFVSCWKEDSPKGHMEWPNSVVVHAESQNSIGPFKVVDSIGKGHNPEIFKTKDGRYVIYVIDGNYIADNLYGPWIYNKFEFNERDRKIIEGLSNLSFAQREDGSFIMVCRGGGIWFSKDGISSYNQVTDKRVYPDVDGRFEDPVIWRDNVQYNMIVNDWLGRIAYYLRSKDGISWKVDPGEAYKTGIALYEDGTREDWFKYERLRILQDKYGRAIQANFAVIDTLKYEDKPNDRHSSKNIGIPLNNGILMEIIDQTKIDKNTKSIRVKIISEEGFNPQTDIDTNSLRFGASEEVNFGRGSRVIKTENSGDDLIVTFEGKGNGITDNNFAAKLLGKTRVDKLLFGYARLPWLDYLEPALSARLPIVKKNKTGNSIEVEVQNFGQVVSKPSKMQVEQIKNGSFEVITSGEIPGLLPFEKTIIELKSEITLQLPNDVKVTIFQDGQLPIHLEGKLKIN